MLNWIEILCAIDLSRSCRPTMEHAAALARRFGAHLTLLHVREGLRGPGNAIVDNPDAVARDLAEIRGVLDDWAVEAERIAGAPARTTVVRGAPAAEIVRTARDGRFDLVVVGARARTGLARLALGLGSVAERVVREAPVPVLVVRPPPEWGD